MAWISIEGSIGSGKTTFIEKVLPHLSRPYTVIPEPVEQWEEMGILKKSYTDPAYVFPAQCVFFNTRIDSIRERYQSDRINFSERSPFTDRIFWSIQDHSLYPDLESTYLGLWTKWQELLTAKHPNLKHPKLIIYLKAPVSVCHDRILERGRESESTIKRDYLNRVDDAHDHYLLNGAVMPDKTVVPCIVIETTANYRDNIEVAKRIAREIETKL